MVLGPVHEDVGFNGVTRRVRGLGGGGGDGCALDEKYGASA